jgi:hypothetical protein
MFYTLLVCIGIILAIKFRTASYRRRQTLPGDDELYMLCGGISVTKAEYDEARQLLTWNFCSNKYCREEILALFIDVRRHLANDKRIWDGLAFSEAVLYHCKKAALEVLDFQDPAQSDDVVEEIDADIIELIKERALEVVRPLTKESDRSFYNNGDGWKVRCNHLINGFAPGNAMQFYKEIRQLSALSSGRIAVQREIYYKAYKFLIDKDRKYSLKLYLQYLHVKTLTDAFAYKRIAKTNRKYLFRDEKEEQQYFQICDKLIKDKDLKAALKRFDNLGMTQRKKIKLNTTSIQEAAGKQARIAGILSDILSDEPPGEPAAIPKDSSPIDNKEALLQLFIDKDYKLNKEEVNIFAQSKGIFTGQLIQRINEEYFDELDDVLIEEEAGEYCLNKTYLQQVRG